MAVFGDGAMSKVANFIGIPYIFIYDRYPDIRNMGRLGRLSFASIVSKIRRVTGREVPLEA